MPPSEAKKSQAKDAQSYAVLADSYLSRDQVVKALAEFASVVRE